MHIQRQLTKIKDDRIARDLLLAMCMAVQRMVFNGDKKTRSD